jgi:hypothetical protein
MTVDEVKHLSDDELRIKVAELCGWKNIEPYRPNGCQLFKDLFGLHIGMFGRLPDYPNDLNAMHEAEKLLITCPRLDSTDTIKGRTDWYSSDLMRVMGGARRSSLFSISHATARQRAEAFVLTMGK